MVKKKSVRSGKKRVSRKKVSKKKPSKKKIVKRKVVKKKFVKKKNIKKKTSKNNITKKKVVKKKSVKKKILKNKPIVKTKRSAKQRAKALRSCAHCGYSKLHIHTGIKCPLCKKCSSCKQPLHSCECHEGE